MYISQGQLDSAACLVLSQAIRIGEINNTWEDLGWALIIQAVVAYYQEDFPSMERLLNRAVYLCEAKLDDPYEHLGTITQLQSILFDATGDYDQAFQASQKTMRWLKELSTTPQGDSIALANAYNTHGAICFDRGDYDQAIHHYKIALDLHRQTSHDTTTLVSVNANLSTAYQRKMDWRQARFYAQAAIALLPEQANADNFKNWILCHQLLAATHVQEQDFDRAIQWLEKLIPISHQFDYHQEWVHSTYGKALLARGKPSQARSHFEIALTASQNKYGAKHPHVARRLRFVANTFAQQGQWQPALQYAQKAVLALSPAFSDTLGFTNPPLENISALTELSAQPGIESPDACSGELTKQLMADPGTRYLSPRRKDYRTDAAKL